MPSDSKHEWVIEHQIFWMLVKRHRRNDVGHVYAAIQAAMAARLAEVDVGAMIFALQPEGRAEIGPYCPNIGPEGMAYFRWIYEISLLEPGLSDYHHYRMQRIRDGVATVAYMKTANYPAGRAFAERYEQQLAKLNRARNGILVKYRWKSSADLVNEIIPNALVVSLQQAPDDAALIRSDGLNRERDALITRLAQIDREIKGGT